MTMKTIHARVALTAALAFAAAPALAQTFNATLNGANEKPAPADPKATGSAKVTLKDTQVCYELNVKDLTAPIAAHIHKGGPNDAGPVAVPLSPPDASGKSQGCVDADAAVAKDIAANPGNYYVNVHTAQYKAGAIRGQLTK
jgi:Cu/Zn superoxide dismutase